jgi:hypothetical protein
MGQREVRSLSAVPLAVPRITGSLGGPHTARDTARELGPTISGVISPNTARGAAKSAQQTIQNITVNTQQAVQGDVTRRFCQCRCVGALL